MRKTVDCGVMLLCVLCATASARGDGFMVPRITVEEVGKAGQMVASPKQEAVLVTDGNKTVVMLRTHFRRGPTELAWVVPVPAMPEDIRAWKDDEVFDALEREFAPRFYRRVLSSGPAFSCGCGGGWDGGAEPIPTVQVELTGTAGVFEFVVLSSRDANELAQWLGGHGYAVPPNAAPVFSRYVREGWHWLAMRVRPEMAEDKTLAPHPITYTYRDTKLVYPLEISRLSADAENEIVLYVVAARRYACGNWTNAEILPGSIRADADSPSGTNYEKVFWLKTRDNGGRLFVTEAAMSFSRVLAGLEALSTLGRPAATQAAPLEGMPYITRLRAIVKPDAMDRDVVLIPYDTDHDVESRMNLLSSAAAPSPVQAAAPLAPLAIGAAGMGLRRRRGPSARRAGTVLCGLALAAVAMA